MPLQLVAQQQLTNLRDWHAVSLQSSISRDHSFLTRYRSRRGDAQTVCRAHATRRQMLAAGGLLLGNPLADPLQVLAAAEMGDSLNPEEPLQLPDFTKPGPFLPMRLPKLEHTASSAFPACLGNQCLLRVTALYPKAAGSGATPPYPLVIFSGGFLVPAAKYLSYAERLASWGYVCLLYDKVEVSSLEMNILSDVVSVAFVRDLITWSTTSPVLSKLTSPEQGVYLCGHSRGGKVSVLAAALDDRVTALCLLDPVDNTKYAPLSTDFPSAVQALRSLGKEDKPQRAAVPMAVIGGALSADCAPKDANYRLFYNACSAPSWEAVVPDTGHFQFLDEQSTLDRAVCASGRGPDASVRAFSQAAMVAWAEIMVKRRDPVEREQLLQSSRGQLERLLPGAQYQQKNLNVL